MQSNASCIDQDKTILFLIALPEMDQTDLKQCSTICQPAGPGVETLARGEVWFSYDSGIDQWIPCILSNAL